MVRRLDFDTRLSPEGRVVVPAAVRSALGVGPGDRLRFVLVDGEVRLVAAHSLLSAVWANNQGEGLGDSVEAVRELRAADRAKNVAKERRLGAHADVESRDEGEIEERLLAQLGLTR